MDHPENDVTKTTTAAMKSSFKNVKKQFLMVFVGKNWNCVRFLLNRTFDLKETS